MLFRRKHKWQGHIGVAHVTDTSRRIRALCRIGGPAIAGLRGQILARGGVIVKEGQGHARNVVIWFPSLAGMPMPVTQPRLSRGVGLCQGQPDPRIAG